MAAQRNCGAGNAASVKSPIIQSESLVTLVDRVGAELALNSHSAVHVQGSRVVNEADCCFRVSGVVEVPNRNDSVATEVTSVLLVGSRRASRAKFDRL